MGCLKSILKKLLLVIILVCFFAFGGFAYLKLKLNQYQNPTKAEFIETEKSYADFSQVPSDYQLIRNFNLFGYKKVSAKYLPTSQKITIFDLRDNKLITPNDFAQKTIDDKIYTALDKLKDSVITFEDFKILERGNYSTKNKTMPYIIFCAKVKNVPFKTVKGTLAAYITNNKDGKPTTKVIMSVVDNKAYNPLIVKNFISALKY